MSESRSDPVSPALERVLARFADRVRRIGSGHGLAGADVDELFQEVRIRLWRALASGEKIAGTPASYVYRTAVSASVDLIRRRRARPEDPVDELHELRASEAAGPGESLERSELVARIEGAMDMLAVNRRPVVRMYLAGYSRDEIAGLLGWTEAKTRNLLYRGLTDLRSRLTELGIGPEAVQ